MKQLTKRCSTCQQAQPVDEFYWRDKARTQRKSQCRRCFRGSSAPSLARYRASEKAKERERRRDRAYERRAYRQSESGKEAFRRGAVNDRRRHPDRCAARVAVAKAIARGGLIRPDRCERCGGGGVIHAHHHRGYALEHRLDVVWICERCHRDEHLEMRTAS